MNSYKGTEGSDTELGELFAYLDNSCVALEQFGCFAALSQDKSTIFACPMNVNGSPDRDADDPRHMNWFEVTAPEPEFVHSVNAVFGTSFESDCFPGR